ncbi:hypothetical protein GOODEAATRI_030077 [Goodea atripinnis]|uniref:Uncharacterized protein n=1 Tax=Goodea atripinnis TaxID=208336 RepID=A0ABV0NFS7_9TELE
MQQIGRLLIKLEFDSVFVWTLKMCVNTMPGRKDNINEPGEPIIAAHKSVKGYSHTQIILDASILDASSRFFSRTPFPVFSELDIPANYPRLRPHNVGRNCSKHKSPIADSTDHS